MSGLLIKDWKLFKNQGKYFFSVLVVAMAILLIGSEEYVPFSISYITFFVAYFTLSTISYDEYDNGMAFLMTLPVSRRIYVSEKYLLSILLTVGAWLLSTGLNVLLLRSSISSEGMKEMFCMAPVLLLTVLLFLNLSLPLFLKFGPEKGRMFSFGILGVIVLIMFLLGKMGIGAETLQELDLFTVKQPLAASVICILLSVLVIGISWLISLKFMHGKEF